MFDDSNVFQEYVHVHVIVKVLSSWKKNHVYIQEQNILLFSFTSLKRYWMKGILFWNRLTMQIIQLTCWSRWYLESSFNIAGTWPIRYKFEELQINLLANMCIQIHGDVIHVLGRCLESFEESSFIDSSSHWKLGIGSIANVKISWKYGSIS